MIFDIEDFVAPGTTDYTTSIQNAAAALRNLGAGTLWFRPGKTYPVWSGGSLSNLIDLSNTRGAVILGNGATISCAFSNPTGNGTAAIYAAGAIDLQVDGITFHGGNTTCRNDKGQSFFRFGGGTRNLVVTNCHVNYCEAGIQCLDTSLQNYGLVALNVDFDSTFYPLSLYNTDDVLARIVTRNAGRSYFPVAPCARHDVTVDSRPGQMAIDCLLKVYANKRKGDEYNTLKDIRLHYRSDGWAVGGTGSSAGSGAVCIQLQQADTNSAAGHVRNIHISFDVDGGKQITLPYTSQTSNFALGDKVTGATSGATGLVIADVDSGSTGALTLGDVTGTFANGENLRVTVAGVATTFAVAGTKTDGPAFGDLFCISKQNSSDLADTTAGRGHTIRDVTVTGVAKNWTTAQNGLVFFDAHNSMEWSGETAGCLAVRDFVLNGAPVTDSIYVNGKPAESGKPFLTLGNVYCDGPITYANVNNAQISEDNVKCSSFDASNKPPTDYTPSWTSDGTAPSIGDGAIAGRWSKRGREVFVQIRIQPGSTTTFGTGHYYLSLPVALASGRNAWGAALGFESGVANHRGVSLALAGQSTVSAVLNDGGDSWKHNNPWSFKNGDYVEINLVYWA